MSPEFSMFIPYNKYQTVVDVNVEISIGFYILVVEK